MPPSSVLVPPSETCRGHSWYTALLSQPSRLCFLFQVEISSFQPEIGIRRAVKAPVNIPVSWAWPCHLSLGTASLPFSVLPSSCSRWFHCARSSERRNQTPGQERICIELAPFPGGGNHRAGSILRKMYQPAPCLSAGCLERGLPDNGEHHPLPCFMDLAGPGLCLVSNLNSLFIIELEQSEGKTCFLRYQDTEK